MRYDKDFYAAGRAGMIASARAIVPVIYDTLKPASVIDFGCGEGWWLVEFGKIDHTIQLVGIEGMSEANPVSEQFGFYRKDLTYPIDVGRFDLALCLEVAEHLEERDANTLIASLCCASDTVVFSAAIPRQTGVNHVNEQWHSYWVHKFTKRGYRASSYFRHLFWDDERIESWYRQNIILFAKRGKDILFEGAYSRVLDVVHPALWSYFRP